MTVVMLQTILRLRFHFCGAYSFYWIPVQAGNDYMVAAGYFGLRFGAIRIALF